MKRLLFLWVLAAYSVSIGLAAVVQVKPHQLKLVDTGFTTIGGVTSPTVFFTVTYYYTSDELFFANNPFPKADPNGYGYSHSEYLEIYNSRFKEVVGVPETMITDSYYKAFLGPDLSFTYDSVLSYVERPFFNNIDLEVLNGLSDWSWNGAVGGSNYGSFNQAMYGYTFPSASGTFNQVDQTFYASDGRQYQVVPEPSTLFLCLAFGSFALFRRKRS